MYIFLNHISLIVIVAHCCVLVVRAFYYFSNYIYLLLSV